MQGCDAGLNARQDYRNTIITGDAFEVLKALPDGIAQMCITSPPYWQLRDYGVGGQIGLEPTPEEYVEKMVEVFREVRRVLRDDGTLWLNLGDSYASGKGTCFNPGGGETSLGQNRKAEGVHPLNRGNKSTLALSGLKPKDLVGIPWRVAFALRDDGWYLRSDIIWAKPSPLPESVTDRPTKAHEYIFLFAKGQTVSRVVKLSDLNGERVHLGHYFGLDTPDSGASVIAVRLAAAVLNLAQTKYNLSLSALYAEIRKERGTDTDGNAIGGLPVIHRAAVGAARLFDSQTTTKEFLRQLHRFGIALADSDNLLIGGGAVVLPLPPGVYGDGEAAIAVHHSSEISKFDFVHGTIISQRHSGCRYYYDAVAIQEPQVCPQDSTPEDLARAYNRRRQAQVEPRQDLIQPSALSKSTFRREHAKHSEPNPGQSMAMFRPDCADTYPTGYRNKRDVWTVATQPFPGAHFAVFPERLVEPCILAGSSPYACPACGAPWERTQKTSWRPTCSCPDNDGSGKCLVLDPFIGSGTTAIVAAKLDRDYLGIELNPEYAAMAKRRIGEAESQERFRFLPDGMEGVAYG